MLDAKVDALLSQMSSARSQLRNSGQFDATLVKKARELRVQARDMEIRDLSGSSLAPLVQRARWSLLEAENSYMNMEIVK